MDPEFPTKSKKRSRPHTDYTCCLICQKGTEDGSLYKLTIMGYPALVYAVQNMRDGVAFRLSNDLTIQADFMNKQPVMHGRCRSAYTNRKTVDQKTSAPAQQNDSVQPNSEHERTRSSTPSSLHCKMDCFICEKARSKKGDRRLVLISAMDRQNAIWEKAKQLNDESMLRKLQGFGNQCTDMVAGDFKYHRLCMTLYLITRSRNDTFPKPETDPFDGAMSQLISEIDGPVFEDGCVFFLTTLRDRFCKYLTEHGGTNPTAYKSQCLTSRLQKHYAIDGGCRIMVVPQKGTSSLVCASSMSVGRLIAAVKTLKETLSEEEYAEDSDREIPKEDYLCTQQMSYNSARHMRMEIKQQRRAHNQALKFHKTGTNLQLDVTSSSKSLDTSVISPATQGTADLSKPLPISLPHMDISYAGASQLVSNDLYNHMAWLVTDTSPEVDDEGRVRLDQKQHEQVLNIAQDVSAAVAGIPTPKHVGTALHILKETRSKETVTLLNRFGNSISYQDAQRYISTMAATVEEQVNRIGVFIPTNLKVGLFTQYAFDNLDFHEFTTDVRTLHGTTHIIYQYPRQDYESTPMASVPLLKTRQSALKVTLPFNTKESYPSLKDRRMSRSLVGIETQYTHPDKLSEPLDQLSILWRLVHMFPTVLLDGIGPIHTAPTWSKFQHFLIPELTAATIIGYGPFFPKAPTNPDVVETSVEYCIDVSMQMDQEFTIITCDQAIYEVVLGLQKKKPQKYSKLIIRMGGFHIAQNFLGAIGHLMKATGIEDILVEAEVCHSGTVNKIIAGKDYYAMLRAHSVIHAAMFDLHWAEFENWLAHEGKDLDCISLLAPSIQLLVEALSERDEEKALRTCTEATEPLKDITILLSEFDDTCTSPTQKLWLMYMDMVMILKRYIHSERAGLWEEHLAEVETMLPYLVSAGHYKYVSCLPHYLEAMRGLESLAPDVASAFRDGKFNVRQTSGKFNGVWTDMALEKTYNRDAKTKLFTGISQNPTAMDKYIRALPALTAVSEQTKAMAHLDHRSNKHHEDSDSIAAKDVETVQKIKDVIKDKMINPFTCESMDLLNISTGQKAASHDLITARESGLAALLRARESGSEKVEPVKLQTFATKSKKKLSQSLKAKQVYEAESTIVRNLYFVQDLNEEQKVNMFSHEWTKYPASLFEPDTSLVQGYAMRKGNKSDYLVALKSSLGNSWIQTDKLPPSDESVALVVDAMAFIQRNQQAGCSNFQELQEHYMKKLISIKPAMCDCINFIGDRYDVPATESLKGEERERRENNQKATKKEYDPRDTLAIPEWKGYIQNSKNKANLLNYIGESWENHHMLLPTGLTIILGGVFHDPGRTLMLSRESLKELPELSCRKHEEADTRIFAHVAYCVQHLEYKRIVVMATDTDVIMMCIYYSMHLPDIQELWVHKMDVYVPTHHIATSLASKFGIEDERLSAVLLSVYILTGCDTVSYPFRRGKKHAYKIATEFTEKLTPLAEFGKSSEHLNVTDDIMSAARQCFMSLYSINDFSGTLDALRAHLFANSKGDLRSLPPTEDAFQLHVLRALHQIAVCQQAHLSEPSYPKALEFGRQIVQGRLVAKMMDKESKPVEYKQAKYCHCKKSKCLQGCTCARANVKCVIACLCTGNPAKCARVEIMCDGSDND